MHCLACCRRLFRSAPTSLHRQGVLMHLKRFASEEVKAELERLWKEKSQRKGGSNGSRI
jgi:hypothetical protein